MHESVEHMEQTESCERINHRNNRIMCMENRIVVLIVLDVTSHRLASHGKVAQ